MVADVPLWRRIFAVGFTLGVVAGIVMTFEFALNTGPFPHDVGPILGVIIAIEVLTAFFLEARFFGSLVFGEGRNSDRAIMTSTCMVSLGTILSVSWILVANSWMQTRRLPDGEWALPAAGLGSGHLQPSFGIRFLHMLVGSLVEPGFFDAGISAWHLLKHRHFQIARRAFLMTSFWLADNLALLGRQEGQRSCSSGSGRSATTSASSPRSTTRRRVGCLGTSRRLSHM
jgi:cytochrome d ubiquinol oxidase subunit I